MAALDFYDQYIQDIKLTEDQFILRWQKLSEYFYNQYLTKKLSFQEQRQMRVKAVVGKPLSDQKADEIFAVYTQGYKQNWRAFDDVNDCLQQLRARGYALGVISNGDLTQQKEKLSRIGLECYFDYVVTSSDVGAAKPEKDIFLKACQRADVSVKNSYYVGDRLDVDAIASQRVGMNGIWLNRKGMMQEANVPVIRTLEELIPIVC